jgi:hypothetical protein
MITTNLQKKCLFPKCLEHSGSEVLFLRFCLFSYKHKAILTSLETTDGFIKGIIVPWSRYIDLYPHKSEKRKGITKLL